MSVVGLQEAEKSALALQRQMKSVLAKQKKEIQAQIQKIEYLLDDKQALRAWRMSQADSSRISSLLSQLDEVEQLYLEAGDTEAGRIFKQRMQRELSQKLTNLKASQKEVEILTQKLKAKTKASTLEKMSDIQREGAAREMYQQSRNSGGFLSNFGKAYVQDVVTMKTHAAGSKTIGEYMSNLYDTYKQGLEDVLVKGIVRGDSYKTMVENLQKKTGITARKADLLVRTESNAIFNNSVKRVITDNPLVKGYRFRAVLDRRTSKICQQHDGDFIPKEDMKPGVNYPPLHPNCRSTVTTVLYSENERKDTVQRYTKNQSNEWVPVPKGMTYLEFKDKFGFSDLRKPITYTATQRQIGPATLSRITVNKYKGYVKPSVNATKTINKIIDAYIDNDTEFLEAVKKNTGYSQIGKAMLRQAQAETGYDGLPLQQTAKAFTKEVEKKDYKILYRQFKKEEDIEQFLTGTQPYGNASYNFGAGIYTFDELPEESDYGKHLVTMALKSSDNKILDTNTDAHTGSVFTIRTARTSDSRINDILLRAKEGGRVDLLSLAATAYGYDAIKVTNQGSKRQVYYIILNRTALIVKGRD